MVISLPLPRIMPPPIKYWYWMSHDSSIHRIGSKWKICIGPCSCTTPLRINHGDGISYEIPNSWQHTTTRQCPSTMRKIEDQHIWCHRNNKLVCVHCTRSRSSIVKTNSNHRMDDDPKSKP